MSKNGKNKKPAREKDLFVIDSKNCLSCTRLVGDLGKKTRSCSFKNGNKNCPAHNNRIVIGFDAEPYLEEARVAVKEQNFDKFYQLLTDAKSIEGLPEMLMDLIAPVKCGDCGCSEIGNDLTQDYTNLINPSDDIVKDVISATEEDDDDDDEIGPFTANGVDEDEDEDA